MWPPSATVWFASSSPVVVCNRGRRLVFAPDVPGAGRGPRGRQSHCGVVGLGSGRRRTVQATAEFSVEEGRAEVRGSRQTVMLLETAAGFLCVRSALTSPLFSDRPAAPCQDRRHRPARRVLLPRSRQPPKNSACTYSPMRTSYTRYQPG